MFRAPFFLGEVAIMENENTRKSEVLSTRVKGTLADAIPGCVEAGNYKNKSQMLREVFLKHVEKIQNMEVSTAGEDIKK